MINILSKPENPAESFSVTLNKVWKVFANKDYKTSYEQRNSNTIIALRTLQGLGELKLSCGNFLLNANSVIFFKYADVLEYSTLKNSWDFFWFEFDSQHPIPYNKIIFAECLLVEQNNLNACFNLIALPDGARRASVLFSYLIEEWIASDLRGDKTETDEIVTCSIIDIIQNTGSNIATQNIAKKYGISERYFRKIFKEKMQISPKNYILEQKLKAAKELLCVSNKSIAEISYSIGYENPYYFSNFFKQKTGMSPSSYRKSQEKNT